MTGSKVKKGQAIAERKDNGAATVKRSSVVALDIQFDKRAFINQDEDGGSTVEALRSLHRHLETQ